MFPRFLHDLLPVPGRSTFSTCSSLRHLLKSLYIFEGVVHIFIFTAFTQTLFYTNHFWQKPPFAPTSFYTNELFHKLAFTHSTFYTNPHLHRPALTQTSFYPKLIVLEPPFAPTFTPTSSCLSLPRPGSANNVEGEREREKRKDRYSIETYICIYIYIYE